MTRISFIWMSAFSSEVPAGAPRPRRLQLTRIALVAALGLAGALPVYPADEDQAPAHPADYTLGPGDRIRVTVFGHEDMSGEFTISETGTVSMPLAGTLAFGGLALADAERIVVEALKPDYLLNPQVGIEVLEYRPFYIIGEVNNPGSYPYVNGMTVNEAVALAGGFTYRARKNRVTVIRASDATRAERSIPSTGSVLPGDIVKVLERFF